MGATALVCRETLLHGLERGEVDVARSASVTRTEQHRPTLAAHNLSRQFGKRMVVQGIDLELKRGEVLGFLGPNGAGKTTLMRMLTGNLAPTCGSVEICGMDLLAKPRHAKAHLGYLPEIPPLYRELTTDEYLRLAARLHRVSPKDIASALCRIKQRCGLANLGNRLLGTLSKGYQQRVGIAQAIIHEPDVVILDEPTAGLDPNQIREIRSLIRELGAEHAVILSTHLLHEAESICDRVQIMHEGRIVCSETIDRLKQKGESLEELFAHFTRDQEIPAHSLPDS
jgi:ABC-2 type transport system ATP-binding protein